MPIRPQQWTKFWDDLSPRTKEWITGIVLTLMALAICASIVVGTMNGDIEMW
ncbi:MAG: hypothetical protein WD846_03335 [Patescibacteria group bacterium]